MNIESKICERTRNFRSLARTHQIGSNLPKDLQYIEKYKEIQGCSQFQKQDNLLLDSPSRILQEKSFSINMGLDLPRDIYSSVSQSHIKKGDVGLSNLAVTSSMMKKNLPNPPVSVFLMEMETNKKQREKVHMIIEPDIVGLFLRSYVLDKLSESDLYHISDIINRLKPKQIQIYQDRAFSLFREFMECKGANLKVDPNFVQRQENKLKKMTSRRDLKISVKDFPHLDYVKPQVIISFGSSKTEPCMLEQKYTHKIVLRNRSRRNITYKICMIDRPTPDFDLMIGPKANKEIEIKKGKSQDVYVYLTAHRPLRRAERLIYIEVNGGRRMYFYIRAFVQSKVFGIDPDLLERVDVEGIGRVPKILEHLKSELIRRDAAKKVGIFRKAGHDINMKRLKRSFDKEDYVACKAINDFATLVKVWFRELPVKIFDFYSTEYFQKLDANNTGRCLDTLNGLPETSRHLISWLLNFMMIIEEHSDINKMTSSNLAIVFSPNLYEMKKRNPAQMMMLTSKMSQFFQTLLELRISQRRGIQYEEEDGEWEEDGGKWEEESGEEYEGEEYEGEEYGEYYEGENENKGEYYGEYYEGDGEGEYYEDTGEYYQEN